jgi:quercetin dioxygenase-like cupin family protein
MNMMAIKGKEIRNAKTGQRIKFLQTSADTQGSLLEMLATYEGQSPEPPSHYHPYQEEYIEVIKGEVTVRMNGELEVLGPGHQMYIAKSTSHSMWNHTNREAVIRWKVIPALETERFLETVTGLANKGKSAPNGRLSFLQVALVANRFAKVFRMDKPPFFVQKLIFLFLTPFAYLTGHDSECNCNPVES